MKVYAFVPMAFIDVYTMKIAPEGFTVHRIYMPMIVMFTFAGETVCSSGSKDGCR